MFKIFNLNGSSLQIRSKHRITNTSTEQRGTSFELSEFQPSTIKQTCNTRVYEPQIHIVNHDHIVVIICLGTHIIMRGLKSSNFRKKNSQAQDSTFLFSWKTLPSNLSWLQIAFLSSTTRKKRPSGDESSLTSELKSEMCHEALPMR
jgi:hypothetical protein